MLHEWHYPLKDRPKLTIDKDGELSYKGKEPIENLITWVYEEGSFAPSAKIVANETFSIINDYIGRPIQAYNEVGNLIWETDYDIYGNLRNLRGERSFISFRQLGQYEDSETGLYYNRFRYYSPETGAYISVDPIGLAGNNPNFYAYVFDLNSEVDVFGLECTKVKFNPEKMFPYSKGGVMSVMKHILQRHRLNTKYDDVSKFISDSPKQIKKIINEAISNGKIDETTNSLTATLNRNIGTNVDGNLTKTVKIFFDEKGWVRTAFPI